MNTPHVIFANTRVLLVDEYPSLLKPNHILMNAPRPIVGAPLDCQAFMHGQHFASLDVSDDEFCGDLELNTDADAWLVIRLHQTTIVELCLQDAGPIRAIYAQHPIDKQWKSAQVSLMALQGMSYSELLQRLRTAQLSCDWFNR